MNRPVNCAICGEHMFYSGNEKHEDEVTIDIADIANGGTERCYVHKRCMGKLYALIGQGGLVNE